VIWLGRWRRRVHGVDAAKVWLWLEGFDYVDIQASRLKNAVDAWLVAVWVAFQAIFPGLPELTQEAPDEEAQDEILNEVDRQVGLPLQRQGRRQGIVQQTGVVAAALGSNVAEPEEDAFSAAIQLMRAVARDAPPMPEVPEELRQVVDLKTIYDLMSIPKLVREGIDLERVRLIWRGMGAMDDLSHEPGSIDSVLPPDAQPFVPAIRYIRGHLYGLDPRMVVVMVSALSRLVPRELGSKYALSMLSRREEVNLSLYGPAADIARPEPPR
jgi:hypothetical protein